MFMIHNYSRFWHCFLLWSGRADNIDSKPPPSNTHTLSHTRTPLLQQLSKEARLRVLHKMRLSSKCADGERSPSADCGVNLAAGLLWPWSGLCLEPPIIFSGFLKKIDYNWFIYLLSRSCSTMNQTAGATNAYRRCSKGGKVRKTDFLCMLVPNSLIEGASQSMKLSLDVGLSP